MKKEIKEFKRVVIEEDCLKVIHDTEDNKVEIDFDYQLASGDSIMTYHLRMHESYTPLLIEMLQELIKSGEIK